MMELYDERIQKIYEGYEKIESGGNKTARGLAVEHQGNFVETLEDVLTEHERMITFLTERFI